MLSSTSAIWIRYLALTDSAESQQFWVMSQRIQLRLARHTVEVCGTPEVVGNNQPHHDNQPSMRIWKKAASREAIQGEVSSIIYSYASR